MKRWKEKGAGLLAACLVAAAPLGVAQPAFAQEETAPSLYIDGEEQHFEIEAVVKEGRVYVPMRELYEALGAEVSWDGEKEEVTAVREGETTVLPLSKPYAYLNGVLTKLDTPAYEENGRTMAPLRFAGESLGLTVTWNEAANRVDVVTWEAEEEDETGGNKEAEPGSEELSYEEAAKEAVKHNQSYYDLKVSLGKVEDANDRLYLTPGTYNPTMIQQKDNLNLSQKWLEQQLGLVAQGLSVNSRNQMDQISMLSEKLELLEQTKEYLDYALEMAQLKYDYGMLSKLELDTLQSQVNQTTVNIELCRAAMDAGYLALNAALGRDMEDRAELEYEFTYQPVSEEELTEKLRTCTKDDPYLWYAKENLDIKDYKLRTYDYMYDYYGSGLSYPVAELDLAQAKNNVKEIETSLLEQIQIRYNQLRQLELSIQQKELGLEDALRTERAVKLKYQAGMATKAEVMEAELAFPTAVQEIRELQLQHAQLRTVFDQPYLQPDYASASSGGQ